MANTPEVDNWLAATNGLLVAAIALAAEAEVDEETARMMRQVRASSQSLITALNALNLPRRL